MTIELVGLPGAGKTTFARQLSHLGKYKRVVVSSPVEVVWLNFGFMLQHPVIFIRLFFLYIRYSGRTSRYTKFVSAFLGYNAKYIKAKRYHYALLDQGHLQTFMGLFDDTLTQKKFNNILNFLPKSDHYIFFDVSETVRKERLKERGYVSREGISDDERKKWQETASIHFGKLKKNQTELAPATIESVDEHTDIEALSKKYHKAQFMRYITFARMPTEKAHGLQIAKMCEAFTSLGVFVSLMTPKRGNKIQSTVGEYYKLDISLQHREASVFDVTGYSRKAKSFHHYLHQILFAWYVFWMHIPKEMIVYTRAPLVAFVLGLRRRTVIAEQHFWPTRGSWFHRFMLSFAKHIPCNSEGTYSACIEHGLTQAFVAHNGFDGSSLKETISKSAARKNLRLAVDGKVVMYIGSLGKLKGVDTLAKAAECFDTDVKTVVIGGAPEELQAWREQYPHVIFLGPRPYDEIGQHQRSADILVVPDNPGYIISEKYTSPIKLFSHMASLVPLLVSDLSTLKSIVNKEEVFFFKAGDSRSLATAVKTILKNDVESEKRSNNAKKKAKEFTWRNRADNILEKTE